MTDGVRLAVNVSEANWAGVEELMAREGVTETQAVHRLLSYGNLIYQTMTIEQKKVYFEYGGRRDRFRLVHEPDHPDP